MILAVICVSGLQAACQYLLNNPLSWSEALCRYLLVWTAFLTISYPIKEYSVIAIDAFVLFLSKRARQAPNLAVYLFCTATFTVLTVNAWHIVASSAGQKSPAMGLPLAVVYAWPLVGFALSAVRSLGRAAGEAGALIRKGA